MGCVTETDADLLMNPEEVTKYPMEPGQIRTARIQLPGTYMGIVKQQGVDVAITLPPAGNQTLIVDGFSQCHGSEFFFLSSDKPVRIQLEAIGSTAGLVALELKPATARDVQIFQRTLKAKTDRSISETEKAARAWHDAGQTHQGAITQLAAAVYLHQNNQLEEALPRFRALTGEFQALGDTARMATAAIEWARILSKNRRYDQAIEVLEEVRNITEMGNDTWLRGEAFIDMANAAYENNQPQAALAAAQSAYVIFQSLNDSSKKLQTLSLLTRILIFSGRFDEARTRIEEGRALEAHLQQPRGFLMYSGWLAMLEGNYNKALSQLTEVEQQSKKTGNPLPPFATDRKAYTLILMGRHREAVAEYKKLTSQITGEQPVWLRANLALAYEGTGQVAEAETLAREALNASDQLAPEDRAVLFFLLARLVHRKDQPLQALQFMERALKETDRVRTHISNRELGPYYSKARGEYEAFYRDLLWQLHQQNPQGGYAEKAFLRTEATRNRIFSRIIHPGQDADADALAMKEAALEEQLRLAKPREKGSLVRALEEIRATVRTQSRIIEPPSDVKTARELLPPDLAVMSYALGEKRSYLWLITRERFQMMPLAPAHVIETHATNLMVLLHQPHQWNRHQHRLLTLELGKLLLPELPSLEGYTLALIKDGPLHQLPFALLSEEPLIRRHPLIQLPSLSFGLELATRKSDHDYIMDLAVFANPLYNREAPGRGADSREKKPPVGDFRALPYTVDEANGIFNLFPEDKAVIYQGEQVSREWVTQLDLTRFRILHFAVHGVLDEQYPRFSGLALSMIDGNGRKQDGMLYAYELEHRNIRAELVTLSACDTARGRDLGVEGLWGISRGLLGAGASRVLVGLWKVEDQATARCMARFYKNLVEENLPPAKALQQTQIHFLEHNAQPHVWSAFQVQGNWQPMFADSKRKQKK